MSNPTDWNCPKTSTLSAAYTTSAAGHIPQGLRAHWAWICVTAPFTQVYCELSNAMVSGSLEQIIPPFRYAYTRVTSSIQNLVVSVKPAPAYKNRRRGGGFAGICPACWNTVKIIDSPV